HLKRDNERKMGVGGLGQPTESADASNFNNNKRLPEIHLPCRRYFYFVYTTLSNRTIPLFSFVAGSVSKTGDPQLRYYPLY
ncbi:hypothetical protein AAK706_13020, partial [Erysipelotrichaceae bacterium 66-17]